MIANQPVVIDNVSVGGRESRCREGRGGQPTAIPLSSGAAAPRPPPPPPGLAAALGPRPAPCAASLGGVGPAQLSSLRLAGTAACHPQRVAAPH